MEPTRGNCWDFYIGEIRKNLHVVPRESVVFFASRGRFQKSIPEVSRARKQYGDRLVPALAEDALSKCRTTILRWSVQDGDGVFMIMRAP